MSRPPEQYHDLVSKLHENKRREEPSAVLLEYAERLIAEMLKNDEDFRNTEGLIPGTPKRDFDFRDTMLGWSTDSDPLPWPPIMSQNDALLLLTILWRNRKGFLRAWADTTAPSLGILMFVLWRSVQIIK